MSLCNKISLPIGRGYFIHEIDYDKHKNGQQFIRQGRKFTVLVASTTF